MGSGAAGGAERTARVSTLGAAEGAPKLLVVDDGDRYIELLHALLREYRYATRCTLPGPCWECPHREGCDLKHAHDWAETREVLQRDDSVDVVLLDVRFDLPEQRLLGTTNEPLVDRQRLQGLRILNAIRSAHPDVSVVLMTSEEAIGLERAAPLQADEYVTLAGDDAFDAEHLRSLVERLAAWRHRYDDESNYVWGKSRPMRELRRGVHTRIRTGLPLLVLGETGTGKSALAERVIHAQSARFAGPFVSVDLAALPDTLVASELFGSVRGAFSGAVDRPGHFERAHGGTLFLDEIGNLPVDVQRMLLLALQDNRVTRLGDTATRSVDVRLVAATHVDLVKRVRQGSFRADLYARLNPAMACELPPLRERLDDLPELCAAMVGGRFSRGAPLEALRAYQRAAMLDGPARASFIISGAKTPSVGVSFVFTEESWKRMRSHRWPGNLRELEYFLASACLMTLTEVSDAVEQGRAARATLHVPASLVTELLERSWVGPDGPSMNDDGERDGRQQSAGHSEPSEPSEPSEGSLDTPSTFTTRGGDAMEPRPRSQLKDVARDLERDLYRRLFLETSGDFEAMARKLLSEGDLAVNARRVRLRFNQLGLRVRSLRRS